jgi:hypothetical protein
MLIRIESSTKLSETKRAKSWVIYLSFYRNFADFSFQEKDILIRLFVIISPLNQYVGALKRHQQSGLPFTGVCGGGMVGSYAYGSRCGPDMCLGQSVTEISDGNSSNAFHVLWDFSHIVPKGIPICSRTLLDRAVFLCPTHFTVSPWNFTSGI